MKHTLILLTAFILVFSGCNKMNQSISEELEQEITDSLKSIAIGFLKSWEPPFHEDGSLDPFTQSDDFCLIIDGLYTKSYNEWASIIPESMEHERFHYKSYKHQIKEIRTLVLSPNSGVITISYVWDSITKDGKHYNTDGAITFVCRLEDSKWKIVHYHGSHDDERLINETAEISVNK